MIRKRMPSRSGDFLVDQTVPMTFPRNIVSSFGFRVSSSARPRVSLTRNSKPETRNFLDLREYLRRVRHVASCGRNNRASVDVDLLALLDCPAHIVLADKIYGRAAVCTAR